MSFIQTRSSTYQRNQNQRNQNRVCRVKFVVDWIAYQGQRHLRLPSSAGRRFVEATSLAHHSTPAWLVIFVYKRTPPPASSDR